jgi:hypothetical protein
MEAMEAELDPPPLMNAAFARNAKARQGWEIMLQSALTLTRSPRLGPQRAKANPLGFALIKSQGLKAKS